MTKKMFFVSEGSKSKFTYFVTEQKSGFVLSILIFSKTASTPIPNYQMAIIHPIEGSSEQVVIDEANRTMTNFLRNERFNQVDKLNEFDDLLSRIIEITQ